MMKRMFDIVGAGLALIALAPLFALVALLIKLDSAGPILFKQERVGKGFRPFLIYKFRTMVKDAPRLGASITYGSDSRITRTGRILRKIKLDELPQLINVLKGEMSLVGPRPEVREYVELFRADYTAILTVRPGITDLASIKYRDEAAFLGAAADPERQYVTHVLPDKIQLAKDYLRETSFFFDLSLMLKTIFKLVTKEF
jgi:lipopolysaccharide/colanic/teichoic acid biosynthesis glycosyltransferase